MSTWPVSPWSPPASMPSLKPPPAIYLVSDGAWGADEILVDSSKSYKNSELKRKTNW